jgi:protein-L-isoaspartate O-methyltransferase
MDMERETDVKPLLRKIARDWDARARENARYYVNTAQQFWTDKEFFESGERTVANDILTDMGNVCQGRNPKDMTILEVGCGAGRVTRALARLFGKVEAVDVSGEMVQRCREAVADLPNVRVQQNNGMDLSVLGGGCHRFCVLDDRFSARSQSDHH